MIVEGDAGVVDEDVDDTEMLQSYPPHLLRTVDSAQIRLKDQTFAARGLDGGAGLGQAICITTDDGHVGAGSGQFDRDLSANAL